MGLSSREKKLVKELSKNGLLNTYELKTPKIPKYRAPKLPPRVKQNPYPKLVQSKIPPPLMMPPEGAPRSQEYGNYLLQNAVGDRTAAKMFGKSLASRAAAESEEPGLLSKLFDTLSTTTYLGANTADAVMDMVEGEGVGENLGQIAKGVVGAGIRLMDATVAQPMEMLPFGIGDEVTRTIKKAEREYLPKRMGHDVLKEHGVDSNIGAAIGGFAMDVALDPLTYVGGLGLFKKGAVKGAEEILDAKAATSKATEVGFAKASKPRPHLNPPVAEQALQGRVPGLRDPFAPPKLPRVELPKMKPPLEPITRGVKRRQARQLERLKRRDEVGLKNDLPNPARNLIEKMERKSRDYSNAMLAAGKVAEKGDKISIRAANTIANRVAEGKVPLRPVVRAAAPETAAVARNVADTFIDSLLGSARTKRNLRQFKHNIAGLGIKEVPPAQQVNLLMKVMRTVKPAEDEVASALKAAEDHLISLGVQPTWHDGMRVRLSDVVNIMQKTKPEMKFEEILENFKKVDMKKMDPDMRVAIHGLVAERSLHMGNLMGSLTKAATEAQRTLDQTMLGNAKRVMEARNVDTAVRHGIRAGMTYKEATALKKLIEDVVDVNKLPAEDWLNTASRELNKAVDEGRANPELIMAFNNKVANSVGVTSKNMASKITGNRTLDMIMTAVATWWGKGDFQRDAQSIFRWGEDAAKSRSRVARHFMKNYDKGEKEMGWKVAIGAAEAPNERVAEIADFVQNYFAAVLKSTDIGIAATNELNKGASVAERSMVLMEDLNRHLKQMNGPSAFQFNRGRKSYDAFGNAHNFSDGHDWMKSWVLRHPQDMVNFMYDVDLAMERVTKEYAFLDNFAYEFGSLKATPEKNFMMSHPRLKGIYVPEELGRQMNRVMADLDRGHWSPNSPFMKFASKALRAWKTGVTIYLPSHHLRNGLGDLNLMWWAGHNDPRAFTRAKRIMFAQRHRYNQAIKQGNLPEMSRFADPEAAKMAETSGTSVILNQNGVKVTADELYVGAFQRGLLPGVDDLEDIFGETLFKWPDAMFGGKGPFAGKLHGAATKASEYRDHFIRLAHFNAAVNKNLKKTKDLKKAMDEAAFEVRKWHPDGRDMTYFEQKYMRNIIPFYSWLRKSTPLLAETLLTRPAKLAAYPRAMLAIQQSFGMDVSMLDPFPDNQLFPEFIRDNAVGPIGDPQNENDVSEWWGKLGRNALDVAGNPVGYTVLNPGNPFLDFGQQFLGHGPKSTLGGVLDSLNPFLGVPIDLMKNSDFTGAPITKDEGGEGVLQYLSKEIPLLTVGQRLTNYGEEPREGVEPNQPWDREAILNMLTAMGLRGTGPYIKMAEFEAQERARAKKKQ